MSQTKEFDFTFLPKWLEALRSDTYRQGKGRLFQGAGETSSFCCLGVAAGLADATFIERYQSLRADDGGDFNFADEELSPYFCRANKMDFLTWIRLNPKELPPLPEPFEKSVSFWDAGRKYSLMHWLISFNDAGIPFHLLADFLQTVAERHGYIHEE